MADTTEQAIVVTSLTLDVLNSNGTLSAQKGNSYLSAQIRDENLIATPDGIKAAMRAFLTEAIAALN